MSVVHLLEVVEIEEDDGQAAATLRRGEFAFQGIFEVPSIRQPRQPINEGQRLTYEIVTERGKQAASNLQNA